jgi:hypothetical protein
MFVSISDLRGIDRLAASVSKRLLILRPVLDKIGRLVFRMSIRSLVGFGYAALHWFCGFYMLTI